MASTFPPDLALTSKWSIPLAVQYSKTDALLNLASCWSALLPAMASTTLASAYFSTLMEGGVPILSRTIECLWRTARLSGHRPWLCHGRLCSKHWWLCETSTGLQCPRSGASLPNCWYSSIFLTTVVLESEVHPDSSQIALLELIVSKPAKEWAFAHWAIANDDDFEEIVVLFNHCLGFIFNTTNRLRFKIVHT